MSSEEVPRNKLSVPLSKPLCDFIKQEFPDIGAFIISTIEFTVRDSENHYADVMRSLEPLLKDKTKNFVSKIFLFKRRPCNDGAACMRGNCIFTHENVESSVPSKRVSFELPSAKKVKNLNKEVVFNKVDESKYNLENLREYAAGFGNVVLLRRLNRGKYLIVFDNADDAQNLVEHPEPVLNDRDIKKFYNVIAQLEQHKKQDINVMLNEQKEILDKLSLRYDPELINNLKQLTYRIRHYILNKEGKIDLKNNKKERDTVSESNLENSLYSNLFTK